ncbi:MAG: hypothetical protein HC918_13000, partial [Oscillatoriales cyanobacterium SM2_1_8]|nr:hypothetical protein [Oscillatoriales cyanobacterium SM2_1_8]
PPTPQAALGRARDVAQLEIEQQLWLAEYWQQRSWERGAIPAVQGLEIVKQQLGQYVQPRLVWEIFWLNSFRAPPTPDTAQNQWFCG